MTRDSEQALSGKGYVKLGNISLTEDSQECEDDQCTPVAHDENLEMRVRREAARRGGDAVRLERENVAGGTTHYKEGERIATGTRTVYVTERKCAALLQHRDVCQLGRQRTPDRRPRRCAPAGPGLR
ncbi:MAG: hypothetical protein MZV65_14630 [Chromatiales bacterium]|nr:hypothetical protein [Chromatiales bacterium]